eukprot:NODE_6599_length_553_cov_36.815476_g6179_i0.p1 GENE.NODE_6599_length_553_cov_36.815476_g6179_i0~~NODE_6599_length_553_cov_36.815476_g6179_i0.p1  ORF type:complete len:125 (+),score=28.24 NODE_6599_length_553_cov_36.815476_g6179_i0:50-376(+)
MFVGLQRCPSSGLSRWSVRQLLVLVLALGASVVCEGKGGVNVRTPSGSTDGGTGDTGFVTIILASIASLVAGIIIMIVAACVGKKRKMDNAESPYGSPAENQMGYMGP